MTDVSQGVSVWITDFSRVAFPFGRCTVCSTVHRTRVLVPTVARAGESLQPLRRVPYTAGNGIPYIGVVAWRGERAGQVCYLKRGATGPAGVRNWPTMWQAPCLARCGPVRTGRPLAGEGGEEGRGLPLAFGSMSGSRAFLANVSVDVPRSLFICICVRASLPHGDSPEARCTFFLARRLDTCISKG